MSYLLLDDGYAKHPKMSGLPVQAKWLHTCALFHCAENLTDGEITHHALLVLSAVAEVRPSKYVPLLVARCMWKPHANGWTIHDYLEYNPTAQEVKEKRKQNAERQKRWRDVHREVTGRFTSDVTKDVTGDVTRYVTPPHPIPSHPLRDVSLTPYKTSSTDGVDEGVDAHAFWEKSWFSIIDRCEAYDAEARSKLNRTRKKHGASEHELERILFAISQRDTVDPLGKALSMLKKRGAA